MINVKYATVNVLKISMNMLKLHTKATKNTRCILHILDDTEKESGLFKLQYLWLRYNGLSLEHVSKLIPYGYQQNTNQHEIF